MRWQEVLLAAGKDRAVQRMSVVVADALAEELPLLKDDPDLFAAASSTAAAAIVVVLDVAMYSRGLGDVRAPAAAGAFTRELARRNVPVAELDRAYRVAQHTLWRWALREVKRLIEDPAERAMAVEGLSEAAFAAGDLLSSLVTERYAVERERWVGSADAARCATVGDLLDGTAIDASAASERLGYDLGQEHQAFVVWKAKGAGQDPLEAAAAVGGPDALVLPVGIGVVAGWARPGGTDVAAGAGATVALGDPGVGVAGFRRGHLQAMEARRVTRVTGLGGGVVRYADVALLTKDGALAEPSDAAQLAEAMRERPDELQAALNIARALSDPAPALDAS
jgi:hypothetical protein